MDYELRIIGVKEGTIFVVRKLSIEDYFVRAYVPFDANKSTEWELVSSCLSPVRHMTKVHHLTSLSEEELFQESCIQPYDPYYVKAAIEYISDYINSTGSTNGREFKKITIPIQLEY